MDKEVGVGRRASGDRKKPVEGRLGAQRRAWPLMGVCVTEYSAP